MNYLLHILDSLRLERKPGVVSLRVTKVEIKGFGGWQYVRARMLMFTCEESHCMGEGDRPLKHR